MFGFQTKEPRKIDGCSQILLADETHGTNQYEYYQLLNLLVLDDNTTIEMVGQLPDEKTLRWFQFQYQ